MNPLALTVLSASLLASACSHASPGGRIAGSGAVSNVSSTETVTRRSEVSRPMAPREEIRMVAPALEKYTQDRLLGEVWKRAGLTPRDRSIVTVAALIARNQTIEMPFYLNVALDNGVEPREISEITTHLAFYSGWSNAMSAVAVVKGVLPSARSVVISYLRRHRSSFPSTRRQRRSASRASESNSARWRRESCSLPPMCCSATCGCAPTSHPGTEVWSPSAP